MSSVVTITPLTSSGIFGSGVSSTTAAPKKVTITGVSVAVGVGVLVGVSVAVGVSVGVGVLVGVSVGVLVDVAVGV